MNPETFIEQLDDAQIVDAIAQAELQTSGEIRVCVSHRKPDDALAAARQRFRKLGMEQTRLRNGVLIYFIPRSQKFAVWGDTGVHARCGDDYWKGLVEEMAPLLQQGLYTNAIVLAVRRVGEVLARHFPPIPDDRNELPNQVVRD